MAVATRAQRNLQKQKPLTTAFYWSKMEKVLGRYLEPYETVHHVNGKKSDNRPENLEIWVQNGHPTGKRLKDVYDKDMEQIALRTFNLEKELEQLKQQLNHQPTG